MSLVGAIDTSAEDASAGATDGQQTINADGVELEAATPKDDEEAAKKAKKKRVPPLSESHLVGPQGLIRIEREFPERLKPCVKGKEREWLGHLMFLYKEWGYSLYPNMSFEDLAARTETLGARERVRGHLAVMRDVERDRYVRDKHGEEAVETVRELEGAAAAAKRAKRDKHKRTWEEVEAEIAAAAPRFVSRYGDDSDEEAETRAAGGSSSSSNSGVVAGTAKPAAATEPRAPPSAEVLARIEANRQAALKRLREVAAARPKPASPATANTTADATATTAPTAASSNASAPAAAAAAIASKATATAASADDDFEDDYDALMNGGGCDSASGAAEEDPMDEMQDEMDAAMEMELDDDFRHDDYMQQSSGTKKNNSSRNSSNVVATAAAAAAPAPVQEMADGAHAVPAAAGTVVTSENGTATNGTKSAAASDTSNEAAESPQQLEAQRRKERAEAAEARAPVHTAPSTTTTAAAVAVNTTAGTVKMNPYAAARAAKAAAAAAAAAKAAAAAARPAAVAAAADSITAAKGAGESCTEQDSIVNDSMDVDTVSAVERAAADAAGASAEQHEGGTQLQSQGDTAPSTLIDAA